MAKRTVKWSRIADLQYVHILEYWVHRNKSANHSKKLISVVSEKTTAIAKNPYQFKSSELVGIRVAVLGHYSIYFNILPDEILIVAFWDNRQNPKKLLAQIKRQLPDNGKQ